jgi:DNA-binding response OmpR family regulator
MYSRGWGVATVNGEGPTFMAKAAKLKILYGEGDAEAQEATASALEKAGHILEKAVGRKAVEAALSKGRFDLVVLGPTLSRNDRHHLPYMVKKAQAEASVLVMHADGSRHPYVDACTDTGASVENVLARIEGMAIAGLMPAAAAAAGAR